MDFENSADSYDVWLLPDAKKIKFSVILGCQNRIFVQKIVKILDIFVFKALELEKYGGCRHFWTYGMKLHVTMVLLSTIKKWRQPPYLGSNWHLKKVRHANFGQIVNKSQWGQPLLLDAVWSILDQSQRVILAWVPKIFLQVDLFLLGIPIAPKEVKFCI